MSASALKERLIVALDRPTAEGNAALVEAIGARVDWFKVGLSHFCDVGPDAVRMLTGRGHRVFLDLKLHDIPNTVAQTVTRACELGASLITVHASAGEAMLRRASRASRDFGPGRTEVMAVTVLTSDVIDHATERAHDLALLAKRCGCDGVICSPHEAASLREACGPGFRIVTPGIRFAEGAPGDQARVATPAEAIAAGADQIVVGRPIYQAEEVQQVLDRIEQDLSDLG